MSKQFCLKVKEAQGDKYVLRYYVFWATNFRNARNAAYSKYAPRLPEGSEILNIGRVIGIKPFFLNCFNCTVEVKWLQHRMPNYNIPVDFFKDIEEFFDFFKDIEEE